MNSFLSAKEINNDTKRGKNPAIVTDGRRVLDTLELGLKTVVSHDMGSGNQTCGCLELKLGPLEEQLMFSYH